MVEDLHHIGIAVENLDEAVRLWRDRLGLSFSGIEEVPGEGVRVAVLAAGGTRIELLEATRDDSPIARFIARRGPGIHHLAFSVPDCRAAVAAAEEGGLETAGAVRSGAGGTRVAFLKPKTTGGVLVELVEVPR